MRIYHYLVCVLLVPIIFGCGGSSRSHEVFRVEDSQGRIIVLYDDKTWDYSDDVLTVQSLYSSGEVVSPQMYSSSSTGTSQLRLDIDVAQDVIDRANEMKTQGWIYHMPEPKSADADWTVTDGRTTWYDGYWENVLTDSYSTITPIRQVDGTYLGNNKRPKAWRKGGRPKRDPSEIEYLLSEKGGIKPK
ncbi:MAG: hypothetical protein AAFY76_11305 [Cyanobacteria bacterium J06649_11]